MSRWNLLFDELDRVYRECGQLLRDADAQLDAIDYRCWHASANQMGMQTSQSIAKPSEWFPRWLVRFYAHKDDGESAKGPLAFVAVFLSDQAGRGDWKWDPRIEEPLVVAGVIDGDGKTPINWAYWTCKWWFWLDDAEIGGAVSTFEPGPTHKQNWKRMRAFAIPLSRVSGFSELEDLVVQPLRALLDAP